MTTAAEWAELADTEEGRRFMEQNTDALDGFTTDDLDTVDMHAEHHAGGLYVVIVPLDEDHYVKVHDTWGDPEDGAVVVHTYPHDDARQSDDEDRIEHFPTMHDALVRFRELVNA